jgi:hypothetical protein
MQLAHTGSTPRATSSRTLRRSRPHAVPAAACQRPCSPTVLDLPPLPNDIAFAPTDSMQATIWRIPKGGGTPKIWFQSTHVRLAVHRDQRPAPEAGRHAALRHGHARHARCRFGLSLPLVGKPTTG